MSVTTVPPVLEKRRGVDELSQLAAYGQKVLRQVRDDLGSQVDGQQLRKPARLFHSSEAAQLIGISRATLYLRLKRATEIGYPTGQRGSNNNRYFTLSEIHRMRAIEGTTPIRPEGSRALSIAVQHQKGGVGKTTTAVHLAHYSTITGYRTLLIDMDAQSSATAMHGFLPDAEIQDHETVISVFRGKKSLRELVRSTHLDGLDIVPACGAVYSIEADIPMQQVENPTTAYYHFLDKAINEIKDDYDLIILDCPPSLLHTTTAVMWAADGVIVPVPAEYVDFATSVQYLSLTAEVLTKMRRIEGRSKTFELYKILISRYDRNNESSRAISEWIRYIYGVNVFQNPFGITRALSAAGATMNSIYDIAPSAGMNSTTYRRAREIIDPLMQEILDNVQSAWHRIAEEQEGTHAK
ncbi:hypothetical protein CKO15_12925 [Halorhodospira abdelmalekii]|uniref:AAA family ATPase n=1 Tax=Halorhodospira abdelmalekii TaxID=421629 RepID=UPI001902F43B|nr:AAA family ATPase [Halorhodospira abdelmalekii]MBK1736158.1 hypothetical protein [Halorhodospira abdelmalekii]